jgi:hypothetical protein
MVSGEGTARACDVHPAHRAGLPGRAFADPREPFSGALPSAGSQDTHGGMLFAGWACLILFNLKKMNINNNKHAYAS